MENDNILFDDRIQYPEAFLYEYEAPIHSQHTYTNTRTHFICSNILQTDFNILHVLHDKLSSIFT